MAGRNSKKLAEKRTLQEDPEKEKMQETSNFPKKYITSTKLNLPKGWTRTTITIRETYLQKLKDVAWWERSTSKDILDQILEKFFANKDIPQVEKKKIISQD